VNDPHFIGWFPMPPALARFLRSLALVAVLVGLVLAGGLANSQRPPGPGRWDDTREVSFEGIAVAEPYAMLRTPTETILLVEAGKFGAKDRLRPFDGNGVRATGTLIERDGVRMLEFADGDAGLQSIEMKVERTANEASTSVTLEGELVDSKCYLGAMKPGGGKTHKGCAILCLRGGIPPLFVSKADGSVRYYLATDSHGQPLGEGHFEYVGEPVIVTGQFVTGRGWPILKIESVRRSR
jgi:hypothetical protein